METAYDQLARNATSMTIQEMIAEAFKHEDSISTVCDALVRALASSPIRRAALNEAYERNDI